jgi:heterodisulfide reductase subunit A-like polyferredoxin
MLAASGYVCQADESLCIACGDCEEFCQFDALSTSNGVVEVDQTICMGCGVCVDKCDQGALSLRLEASKGTPLEICYLMAGAGLER